MAGKRGKGIIYGGFVIPEVRDDSPREHIEAVIKILKQFKKSQETNLQFLKTMKDKQGIKVTESRIKAIDEGLEYFNKLLARTKE